MVEDRLRKFPNWLASRNLANEASDESVQALIEAVRARYEVPRRWYRLKAQLLGVDKLADYDRLAPVSDDEEHVGWSEARDLVLDSYGSFSGELGDARAALLRRAAGSTRPCARTSAAARSAPTRCPPRTRTCCSTTRTSAAT